MEVLKGKEAGGCRVILLDLGHKPPKILKCVIRNYTKAKDKLKKSFNTVSCTGRTFTELDNETLTKRWCGPWFTACPAAFLVCS